MTWMDAATTCGMLASVILVADIIELVVYALLHGVDNHHPIGHVQTYFAFVPLGIVLVLAVVGMLCLVADWWRYG